MGVTLNEMKDLIKGMEMLHGVYPEGRRVQYDIICLY
jgi:hypothetical protein